MIFLAQIRVGPNFADELIALRLLLTYTFAELGLIWTGSGTLTKQG